MPTATCCRCATKRRRRKPKLRAPPSSPSGLWVAGGMREMQAATAIAVAACISRIPPATQSPEGEDGGARNFGLRLRLFVAHLQQVAVGIQHLDQADDAAFVGGKRVLARTRERRFTPRQDADLGLAFDEG